MKIDRQFYIGPMIDRVKVYSAAEACATAGEVCVVHEHSKDAQCHEKCVLLVLSVTTTPWSGDRATATT